MTLINIGFGNMVNKEQVVAVVAPLSAPIKRVINEAREKGLLIDASFGRKTKSVIVSASGHIILSALATEAVSARLSDKPNMEQKDE